MDIFQNADSRFSVCIFVVSSGFVCAVSSHFCMFRICFVRFQICRFFTKNEISACF